MGPRGRGGVGVVGGDTLSVTRPGDRQESECRTRQVQERGVWMGKETDRLPRQQAETEGEERRVGGAMAPGEPQSAPVVQERQTGARQPTPHLCPLHGCLQ